MIGRLWKPLGVALGIASLGFGGMFGATAWRLRQQPLQGISVAGHLPPAGVSLSGWLSLIQSEMRRQTVVVAFPTEETDGRVPYSRISFREVTLEQLGVELDIPRTEERVLAHLRSQELPERVGRIWGLLDRPAELPLDWTFDAGRGEVVLQQLSPLVHRDPVDARLDLVAHRRVPDRDGRELDIPQSLDAIEHWYRDPTAVVDVATRPIPAAVRSSQLLGVDVSQVLSSYETGFGGTGQGRAVNIERAARYLSGSVLLPGQKISFNALVGPRTLERGFTWAPEIFDDELRPGVGGGVCQAASTFHAASVMGGLEVLKRRSHSRPSSYLPIGLDAMVLYGEVDLEVRNPYSVPLIVHATLPTSTRIRVELLGRPAPGKVEYSYTVTQRHEFYRRITTKPWLGTQRIKKQKGSYGYDVVSLVRITRPNDTQETRAYKSEYRPTPEVFWVGPAVDQNELPKLPSGADFVEVDGARVADVGQAAGAEGPTSGSAGSGHPASGARDPLDHGG